MNIETKEHQFYAIEVAALAAICDQYPGIKNSLNAQLESAVVTERTNTGAGFFIDFQVCRSCSKVDTARVIGDVYAFIEGLRLPVNFLLFLEDGFAACLEIATLDNCDTFQIELASVQYKLLDEHELAALTPVVRQA